MQVVNGAQLMCSFGSSPSSLIVLPLNRTVVDNQPEATIQDYIPMVNIMPFGMCMTPDEPASRGGHDGSIGGADAAALYPRHVHAVDARGADRRHCPAHGTRQHFDLQLHVGRCDYDREPGAADQGHSMTAVYSV
jgi:hypothetical protein